MTWETVQKQEELLQFEHFSNDDGIAVGQRVLELARAAGLAISVDISRGDTTLFHACLPGTGRENELWMNRKRNVVRHFERSSVYFELIENGEAEILRGGLSLKDYCASGGGFPVRLKETGVIGAVIVSGLEGAQDHMLAATAIAQHLGVERLPEI